MTRLALSRPLSVAPSRGGSDRPRAATPSPKVFSLHTLAETEPATRLAARRALMSRKGVPVEEVNARARERRLAASRIQRFDRHARLMALMLPAAGTLAWVGSTHNSVSTLLAGYALLALATIALLARLTRTPEAARAPLEYYYLADEHLASADDLMLLRRLAQQDPELDVVTTAWWRSMAPLRKGDIRLATDFHATKHS